MTAGIFQLGLVCWKSLFRRECMHILPDQHAAWVGPAQIAVCCIQYAVWKITCIVIFLIKKDLFNRKYVFGIFRFLFTSEPIWSWVYFVSLMCSHMLKILQSYTILISQIWTEFVFLAEITVCSIFSGFLILIQFIFNWFFISPNQNRHVDNEVRTSSASNYKSSTHWKKLQRCWKIVVWADSGGVDCKGVVSYSEVVTIPGTKSAFPKSAPFKMSEL